MSKKIYKGLVVNDYKNTPYATWIKEGVKTIETRMNRSFSFRGDVIICCGKTNSIGPNAGKALCIVEIYAGGNMQPEHAEASCIEYHPKRKVLLLRNWRYFSRDFEFSKMAIQKNFQGMFDMKIPEGIEIIPQTIQPYKIMQIQPQIEVLELRQMSEAINDNKADKYMEDNSISGILYKVADRLDITEDLLIAKTRNMEVVNARHIAMYLLLKAGYSQKEISIKFDRHHSSVIHARDKISQASKASDPALYGKMRILGIV